MAPKANIRDGNDGTNSIHGTYGALSPVKVRRVPCVRTRWCERPNTSEKSHVIMTRPQLTTTSSKLQKWCTLQLIPVLVHLAFF